MNITIEQARQIAEKFSQTAIVVCVADSESAHVVTWGRSADEKLWTARLGDQIKALSKGGWESNDDFRADPRAQNAAVLREALELLQQILRQGCLSPPVTERAVKLIART